MEPSYCHGYDILDKVSSYCQDLSYFDEGKGLSCCQSSISHQRKRSAQLLPELNVTPRENKSTRLRPESVVPGYCQSSTSDQRDKRYDKAVRSRKYGKEAGRQIDIV